MRAINNGNVLIIEIIEHMDGWSWAHVAEQVGAWGTDWFFALQ